LFLASAATAAALALAGCVTEGTDLSGRAMTPLSPKMLTEFEQKNMNKDSPILVRIFKEEAELEVWKQDRSGRYALLKTYPICRWSGELGPKLKEGDRQAPEGFYAITPAQMNPKSRYYLAFNMGYPNAYDRAWGRTGAELMIHGDCSSRGCYAMTDEQIAEIYALGREAFFGGQRAFQVQAYPFRMTPANLAKHRNNPNMAFWKMLKRGNDHFEVTRLEPKVDICEKRYVFDAQPPAGSTSLLSFNSTGKCPAYQVPSDIVTAVNEKQRSDEYQTAELITRGARTSPIRTGTDGGMHPVFLAALQRQDGDTGGTPLRTLAALNPPGSLPRTVVPPRAPQQAAAPAATVTTGTIQRQPPAPPARLQTAASQASPPQAAKTVNYGGVYSNIYASANVRTRATTVQTTATAAAAKTAPAPKTQGALRDAQPKVAERTKSQSKSTEGDRAADASAPAPTTGQMAPAGSFESRWLAITSRSRF
jgi:murein L,D-transpeptidase YafK